MFNIITIWSIAQEISQMTELDSGHEFIKSCSGILADKEFFRKLSFWVFRLKQLHKLLEQTLMHHIPDELPFSSIFIQFFNREYFLCLKLIQIFIDSWAFDCFLLIEVCVFKIIKFNLLTLPIIVIQISNTMTKLAIFWLIKTQSSEKISTE